MGKCNVDSLEELFLGVVFVALIKCIFFCILNAEDVLSDMTLASTTRSSQEICLPISLIQFVQFGIFLRGHFHKIIFEKIPNAYLCEQCRDLKPSSVSYI